MFPFQKHRFNHLVLLVHKSGENLIVVGGLFDNIIVSLVWESLLTKVSEELETDPYNYKKKSSKIRMSHFGKRQ